MNLFSSVHLVVQQSDIPQITVRTDSKVTYGDEVDLVYVALMDEVDARVTISGPPSDVIAFLMAAAGRIMQAQDVAS